MADNNENVAELEDIFKGSDPEKDFRVSKLFLFPKDTLEFLPLAEEQADSTSNEIPAMVIFEKNGVHYIDDDACDRDQSVKKGLDSNFARLVESVVSNGGPSALV